MLVANPTYIVAYYGSGTFTLTASGGVVPGYRIIAPPPQPNYGTPSASPSADGTMKSGQTDTISVYSYTQAIFTVQPDDNQPPLYITVSPTFPIQ